MKSEVVKVWKEDESVLLPKYMTAGAACCDVYAWKIEKKYDRVIVHTGLHVEIPEGYEIQIKPRSGMTKYRIVILNTPGIIDSDFRGGITIVFTKIDEGPLDDFPYKEGERCAQMSIHEVIKIDWHEVTNKDCLSNTERGEGGYNSTGK